MRISWKSILLSLFVISVITNLVLIDIAVFGPKPIVSTPQATKTNPTTSTPESCSPACLQAIDTISTNVASQLQALPTPKESMSITTSSKKVTTEWYIPLGAGSTESDQWEDVNGAESYIDTANYGQITSAYFEASMHIPTKNGIMSARLYNVTDKHPVWFSDVSTDADKSTRITSAKIKLDTGNKLYRVQVMTSLKYPSLLDFARIKVVAQK
jgi:hypothetical protein